MSKVGDVVFCVDCDLARDAQLKVAVGDSSGPPVELRRRMATKKDASGDALCTACLDARVQRRRLEFLKPQAASAEPERAAPLDRQPRRPTEKSVRRFSSVRIERVRPTDKRSAPKPLDKKRVIAELLAEVHSEAERASTVKAVQARAKSLQLLAAEIGLSRAHELLAQIRAAALTLVERTR